MEKHVLIQQQYCTYSPSYQSSITGLSSHIKKAINHEENISFADDFICWLTSLPGKCATALLGILPCLTGILCMLLLWYRHADYLPISGPRVFRKEWCIKLHGPYRCLGEMCGWTTLTPFFFQLHHRPAVLTPPLSMWLSFHVLRGNAPEPDNLLINFNPCLHLIWKLKECT